jgi:hypothetical protein
MIRPRKRISILEESSMRRLITATTAVVASLIFGLSGSSAATKVIICHKGEVIEVSQSAVAAHLAHGDRIGSCEAPPPCSSSSCLASPDAATLTIE